MIVKAVCLLMQRSDGRILSVSRKYDQTKFGLPGGKIESNETEVEALTREIEEEVGIIPFSLQRIYEASINNEKSCATYNANSYFGTIGTCEPHLISWKLPIDLVNGPFGQYNRKLFDCCKITY